ncbi:Relaxin receptor 2 [Trichoplax sp. H2]|uniref:G-protein coupled receptors family 1 profile domain-containing protein n=1 Tax=Trichoplax adhaerens TaxID=10228 RepID=B3S493_TRIAD|nr:predicted protein [Trichoplax adhaerens]EDV22417.1 predicted protein [Trichoplax adhaerens]RDD41001.1 Relaxin receptor 2 [Trichoplax sp. H2]|eukprot:XP_002114961.1 predicted protein [Trichoplax adhaerens]
MERLAILSDSLISKFLVWTCGPLGLIFNLYVFVKCIRNLAYGRKLRALIFVSQAGSRLTDTGRKVGNKYLPNISKVASLLFLSLSIADLLSSLYLLSLALADSYYSSLNYTLKSDGYKGTNHNSTLYSHNQSDTASRKNASIISPLANQWISSPLCLILRFLTVTGPIASALTTFMITVDRFFIVVYPLKVSLKLNLSRALKCCCGIWSLSIICGIATCIIATYTVQGTFNDVSWYNRLCIIDDASNGYVLPYVVFLGLGIFLTYISIAIIYIITLAKIHNINAQNKHNRLLIGTKRSDNLELGVIITGLIVAAGVLSWMPAGISSALFAARLIPYHQEIVSNFATITTLIMSANCLVNPIIFIILSRRIKSTRNKRKQRHHRNKILPSF